jgi:hypothetical protein
LWITPGVFNMSLWGKIKRVARSKIVQAGLSAATGGWSRKAIAVGKQLGAVIRGGKLALKQSKSMGPRLAVAGMPPIMPPSVTDGASSGEYKPKTIWAGPLKKAIRRKGQPKARKAKSSKALSDRQKDLMNGDADNISAAEAKWLKSKGMRTKAPTNEQWAKMSKAEKIASTQSKKPRSKRSGVSNPAMLKQQGIMKAAGVAYRKAGSPGDWKGFVAKFRAGR